MAVIDVWVELNIHSYRSSRKDDAMFQRWQEVVCRTSLRTLRRELAANRRCHPRQLDTNSFLLQLQLIATIDIGTTNISQLKLEDSSI